MRIIPAVDIINGKCVRLTKGDYSQQKIYNEDPLEVARMFEDFGIKYLHLVDLDGAKAGRIIHHKILESLAANTRLNIDFGGGIKSLKDVQTAFDAGAKQITVGSIAVQKPMWMLEWLDRFGVDKIILGADCKNRKIATNGWLESSELEVLSFIEEYAKNGIKYSIVTDIEKDGMLSGPSFELYEEILSQTEVKLIASGGITTLQDLIRLEETGCEGAIIGKAIYEGKIPLKQLSALC